MSKKKFYVVNSFAEKSFGGNPAAVFPDASGLNTATMQSIAKQLNLVETVFIISLKKSKADFEFRYFTPKREYPIAGHPTIAAFIALAKANIINASKKEKYFIKNKKGIQEITVENQKEPTVVVRQTKPIFHKIITGRKDVADVLGVKAGDIMENLPIQVVDTGLRHFIIPLKSIKSLMRVRRNTEKLKDFSKKHNALEVQAFTFQTYNRAMDLHTRNISPHDPIEDPGCGAGNAALGAYLLKYYFKDKQNISLKAEQGHITNMPCVIEIYGSRAGTDIQISIGGKGRLMVEGNFFVS